MENVEIFAVNNLINLFKLFVAEATLDFVHEWPVELPRCILTHDADLRIQPTSLHGCYTSHQGGCAIISDDAQEHSF